ncbi:hypothetical protein EMPS_02852 [Entomortierella parvispora]|uniref:SCP domain-containing protein n=1 Tax=Entomortierella parvispora TaxID=205924 RepID=A0A9P3H5P3_9FUNG|nr:hypothetical protein EMPS_02852 [Entomortierella parvispora]
MLLHIAPLLALAITLVRGTTAAAPNPDQINEILSIHNSIRQAHRSAPLTWNEEAAKYAINRATAKCGHPLSYSPPGADPKYGESVIRLTGRDLHVNYKVAILGLAQVEKSKDYNYNVENPYPNWLTFTQLLWKETTEIGCGSCQDDGGVGNNKYTVVCVYLPFGNVRNHYKQNVKPELGRTTVKYALSPEEHLLLNSAEFLGTSH